jgi:hypothetical protein
MSGKPTSGRDFTWQFREQSNTGNVNRYGLLDGSAAPGTFYEVGAPFWRLVFDFNLPSGATSATYVIMDYGGPTADVDSGVTQGGLPGLLVMGMAVVGVPFIGGGAIGWPTGQLTITLYNGVPTDIHFFQLYSSGLISIPTAPRGPIVVAPTINSSFPSSSAANFATQPTLMSLVVSSPAGVTGTLQARAIVWGIEY